MFSYISQITFKGQNVKSAICVWEANLVKIIYNNNFLSRMVNLSVDRNFSNANISQKCEDAHLHTFVIYLLKSRSTVKFTIFDRKLLLYLIFTRFTCHTQMALLNSYPIKFIYQKQKNINNIVKLSKEYVSIFSD